MIKSDGTRVRRTTCIAALCALRLRQRVVDAVNQLLELEGGGVGVDVAGHEGRLV